MSTETLSPARRSRPHSGPRRAPVAAVFAVAALASVFIQIFGPGWSTFVDLEVYRAAAMGIRHGQPLYDHGFGSLGLPFTYPPFAVLVFLPFSLLPLLPLGVAWYALSLLALVDSCVSLRRWGDAEGWRPVPPLLVAACALALEPVSSTLEFGQVNLVLLALLLRDASGRRPGWLPQGVLTGICAGFKLTPAAFGLYYLATGRFVAVRNAALAGVGTVLVSAVFLPAASRTFWLEAEFADPTRPGAPYYLFNQSLAGMLTRWLPPDTGSSVATSLALPVVLIAGLLARRAHREGRDLLAFAAVTTVPLLISPISWTHHWVTVVVPLLALVAAPWRTALRPRLVLAGLLVAVFASRAMNLLPGTEDRELTYGWAADLLSASYALAALVFLGLLVHEFRRARPDGPATPGTAAEVAGNAVVAQMQR